MLLHRKFAGTTLILGSQSPRRRSLIQSLGLDVQLAEVREIDETFPSGLRRAKIAEFLAELKSDAYADLVSDKTLLLTADTIVWQGGNVIGKPTDYDDAVRILKQLSGRRHKVYTGVCLRSKTRVRVFSVASTVRFNTLTDEEIHYYVSNCEPYDKAGAYGIQEWIGYIGIRGIRGSFYNVMGLPMQRLYEELKKF